MATEKPCSEGFTVFSVLVPYILLPTCLFGDLAVSIKILALDEADPNAVVTFMPPVILFGITITVSKVLLELTTKACVAPKNTVSGLARLLPLIVIKLPAWAVRGATEVIVGAWAEACCKPVISVT